MSSYHIPVMLRECIEGLAIKQDGVYVDVTYGGGGHSREILKKLGDSGVLIAFDQDTDAVKNKIDDPRLHFCKANFKYLQNFVSYYRVGQINGILADLGVSSHHLDEGSRGFSFRFNNAELDMRMNEDMSVSAKEVLNSYSQPQLAKVFRSYGELDKASPMANAICSYRKLNEIKTTDDLEKSLEKFLNNKFKNRQLAQVYQAIRIEVNQEIQALEEMLTQATRLLKSGGRLVVMSYHSLEDRLVKNLIQTGNVQGERKEDHFGQLPSAYKAITKKPVVASEEELERNSRARSAKLRIAEKV